MLPTKLAFVDIETTGTSVTRDRIIEIGIIRVENGKVVKTFESLVDPSTYLRPEISSFTGITAEDLKKAPTFVQIKDTIKELLHDCMFVAHNAQFDYGFLKNEFSNTGFSFSAKRLCTLRLSRLLYPTHRKHDLESLIERWKIKCKRRHRGFDDAKAIWEFYKKVGKSHDSEKFEKIIDKILKKPNTPIKVSQGVLDALPECPGVYIFYSKDTPLYVGKSKNIRKRVLSHFSDATSNKEIKISQQIESIENFTTAGEIGALLLESKLIKEMQPLYNKRSRYARDLFVMKILQNKDSYFYINLENTSASEIDSLDHVCIFRSKRQAKDFLVQISRDFSLCDRFLGLEKTKRACFSYNIGKCNGACKGEESAVKYNMRFTQAVAPKKLKSWPFSKSIAIFEGDGDEKEVHVVDKWRYLGTINKSSQKIDKNARFDLDAYSIISKFVNNRKNARFIKEIDLENAQVFQITS